MRRTNTLTPGLMATASLGFIACGGPAPGEGMESKMAPEALPEVVSAQSAIQIAAIPAIDPETMEDAEIDKVLPPGARCGFSYTSSSQPVLSGDGGTGVVKIHGRLVKLQASTASSEISSKPAEYRTEGMRLTVRLLEDNPKRKNGTTRQEAEMHFEIEEGLTVGYRGYYTCKPANA